MLIKGVFAPGGGGAGASGAAFFIANEACMKRCCKITVLKTNYDPEVAPDWVHRPCVYVNVGDVYYTGGEHGDKAPEGLCYMAWESLRTIAVTIASGGKVFGEYETYTGCCPNGGRPVVFLLEPAELEE